LEPNRSERSNGRRLIVPIPSSLLSPEIVASLPARSYDVVVVGAGVAGLAFTLRLNEDKRIALLTKGHLGESNTRYAQGGLSAALGFDDSPELHESDTMAAGAGMCDPEMVHRLVEGAPEAVDWLLSIGTRFDRDGETGELLLGREAAHSRRRVLHAGGDATGAEIERALVAAVRARPNVDIFDQAFAIDLIVDEDRVGGLTVDLGGDHGLTRFEAPVVIIAAGGAGQLWATTSNPAGATADGLAMAIRAGVAVADLEFTQFHPTVLALPGETPFLISEAVRGEGAYLRGKNGGRFMVDLHPMAELAPRDVVARAIQQQMAADEADFVWLDLRHLDGPAMDGRFPTIASELAARGLDFTTDLIPIAPAAHYFMGGIVAGSTGETSLPGLLAIGEAACTGVHGANRLASNSLLEGLVFGLEAADKLNRDGLGHLSRSLSADTGSVHRAACDANAQLANLKRTLQLTMSKHVAVVRDASGLAKSAITLSEVAQRLPEGISQERWEVANMATAATAIIAAAQRREESRGAHFRSDFPVSQESLAGQHLILTGGLAGNWQFGSLAYIREPLQSGV
jgi:L-aspartate oxidase